MNLIPIIPIRKTHSITNYTRDIFAISYDLSITAALIVQLNLRPDAPHSFKLIRNTLSIENVDK